MIVTIIVGAVLFYFIGVIVERYKWVRSVKKKDKFIEVDGKLYSVYRVNVKLKKGDKKEK